MPQRFALKELIAPKVYPLGKNENIRDYLPLNEAAIQRYMRHSSIVETYWADVRCLHPDTGEVLDVGAGAPSAQLLCIACALLNIGLVARNGCT